MVAVKKVVREKDLRKCKKKSRFSKFWKAFKLKRPPKHRKKSDFQKPPSSENRKMKFILILSETQTFSRSELISRIDLFLFKFNESFYVGKYIKFYT